MRKQLFCNLNIYMKTKYILLDIFEYYESF